MKLLISGKPPTNENIIDYANGQLMREDVERFNEMLFETLEPQKPYLTDTEYNLYRRGKKLRPLMLMLFARVMTSPDVRLPDKVIKGAVALEMLHVATLIHDDIIDEALLRRGFPSVNAARGTGTAIIIGDMQFVQSIRAFVDTINTQEDMGLVKLVLDTAFDICCGELDELQKVDSFETKLLKERYMKTVDRKTAILFGLACESGVTLTDSHTSDARRAGFYGRRFGRAFQIMDDIYDFTSTDKKSGKKAGMDLANRRLSLPIIYAMDELGFDNIVSRIIRGDEFTGDELKQGISDVNNSQAIYASYNDARAFALESIEYLRNFPQNRYTKALGEISLYIVNRES